MVRKRWSAALDKQAKEESEKLAFFYNIDVHVVNGDQLSVLGLCFFARTDAQQSTPARLCTEAVASFFRAFAPQPNEPSFNVVVCARRPTAPSSNSTQSSLSTTT